VARALRIPHLVDLIRSSDPREIALLAGESRLDRDFSRRAPLLNRLVLGRVRRTLQLDGTPLPPVAPRGDPDRLEAQRALAARLASAPPVDAETLAALGAYVRGEGAGRSVGPLAQQAVGRLFDPGYRGDAAGWKAARRLNTAARSLLSPRVPIWRLTGTLERSRRLLADRVGGDRAGLHGTAIAVHNLVESLEAMRKLASRGGLARYSPVEAASLCLSAPASVLRQATAPGTTSAAPFREGTLVLLQLGAARTRTLSDDVAFMSRMWSACPAERWVPAFLAAVWARAAANPGESGR
jgi:hypothetical protein